MTAGGITVRPVGPADLGALVLVHRLAFPASALSVLGDEAVRRYYDWQLTGPHDAVAAFAAFDGRRPVGFCVAGVFRGALSGYLHANRAFLVRALVAHPALLAKGVVRSRLRRRAAAMLRGRGRRPTGSAPAAYGILAVGVAPEYRRRGIGRALVLAVEGEAGRRGFDALGLTVAVDNEQAIRFYEAAGWARDAPADQWSGRMVRRLAASPARPASP